MKRKINKQLLMFFVMLLFISTALLKVMIQKGQEISVSSGSPREKLFFSESLGNMDPETFIGIAAFLLMVAAGYGIFKVFQGAGVSVEDKGIQMPPAGCILLSAILIGAGGAGSYLEWFGGQIFSFRYRGIIGIVFIFLGGLMFYRGLQGKEYRFWHKDWKSLDEEKTEKEKDSQK